MASRATWEYHGAPQHGKGALVVQFSNGTIQSPESVNFTLYSNKDDNNPKAKRQRILAAETDRLSYVANNFTSDAVKSNSLCRYFVGVLNKETGKMEVYDSEQYRMQPILESNKEKELHTEDVMDQPSKSYREKVDALIESFGTNKQKRALSSRKLNQVGSEILNKAMAKAAEEIIESRGTKELVKDAVDKKQQETSLFLPPCDYNANKPENAYKFDDLISPVEYAALETASAAFRNMTSEDLLQMVENKKSGLFVLQELQGLREIKDEKALDHQARCLWYLDALIKLSQLRTVKRKDIMTPECPGIICGKLMKNFTVEVFKNGRIQNSISGTTKTKIVAYVIAIALHISDFQVDLTLLQSDMKLQESRILEIAKAMGLKIAKRTMYSESLIEEGHKIGMLTIPLTVYKPSGGELKRKKM
ncbi:DNA-directed RNA polymerase I subunit RPA49 [Xenopus tropicalis]|uniref:DNA-directed RNA polymerase I subunit RPA49 n=1 Tax=Xenopus tropicalis TaxID=8364 RepID=B1H209_XENTR|nr:DNA-directed RNA polymerase I subunit RPA49 [Xenopus tropicalis]AAI60809.1 LOC100145368 protein [Xenopus tropicalis]|eukprot:NP_001120306.1 DNA-directed RNA polymerase I subunit RPA49 [Xenopus tropicalis]